MMRILFGCLVSMALGQAAAWAGEQGDFLKGEIIPKVATLHDQTQTFALYLPKNYSTDRKWPVLYAFSPGANGIHPARLFEKAAERFGWIVLASNNSREGDWKPNQEAIDAIWKDSHARFSVDESRLYATGFSGGARVGFQMAMDKGKANKPFAGVIPCGAGLPSSGDYSVKDYPMLVCGIVGETCFNLPEMLRLDATLKGLKIQHRLLVFDGGHAWPPEDFAFRAVRYLELYDRIGKGKADDKGTVALLDDELEDIEALLAKPDQLYVGYEWLKEWEEAFKGTPSAAKLKEKLDKLESSDAFKKEDQAYRGLLKLQIDLRKSEGNENQFEATINSLRAFQETQKGTYAAKLVAVQLNSLPQRLGSAGIQLMKAKRFAEAGDFLKRARILVPGDGKVHYALAQVLAQVGRKSEACQSLQKAIELGVNDLEQIRNDPLLEPLVAEKAYQDILGGGADKAKEKGAHPD